MPASRLPLLMAAILLAFAMDPGVTSGQEAATTGTISGSVFDSTAFAPLADAAVVLWDTPHRTETDTTGHFVLRHIPPGKYTLVYFHTRLGEMGISPGPTEVSVGAGEVMQVELATPSIFTLVTSECLFTSPTTETSVLAGFVADGDSGTGLPGARVRVDWEGPGGEIRHMDLRADASGWYRTCSAPSDVPLLVSAEFLDRQGLRREVTLEEGARHELGFLLFPLTATNISGRLLDASTGTAIQGATVWLRGTGQKVVTDEGGAFRLGDVDPGSYVLMAEHLAYGTVLDSLEVPPGQSLSVEMRLDTEAIEISPLTVVVEARPLTERAMGGILIDRAAIDRVRRTARDASDILRRQNIPGVIVRRRADGGMCVGYMPGQVRMMFNSGCVPMVIFINNVRATNTELALQLPPESIDHIIVYKPVEAGSLFGSGSMNGVLAIFTKVR